MGLREILAISFVLVVQAGFGEALSNSRWADGAPLTTREAEEQAGKCQFKGNPDVYGLGVRLGAYHSLVMSRTGKAKSASGIYLQWLGSYLSNNFIPEEISSQLDANAIFLFALFLAMMKNTLDSTSEFHALDALVLLELSFGYFFSVLSIFGYRTLLVERGNKISTIGTYFRLLITTGVSGYAVWFWFAGHASLLQSPCGLPTKMFFFTNLDIKGAVRHFWRVTAILCVAYYGLLTIAALVSFTVWFWAACRALKATRKRKQNFHDIKFWEHAVFRAFQPQSHERLLDRQE